jgi:hypothetical protein
MLDLMKMMVGKIRSLEARNVGAGDLACSHRLWKGGIGIEGALMICVFLGWFDDWNEWDEIPTG